MVLFYLNGKISVRYLKYLLSLQLVLGGMIGLLSCTTFLHLIFADTLPSKLFLSEVSFIVLLLSPILFFFKRIQYPNADFSKNTENKTAIFFLSVFLIILLVNLFYFLVLSLGSPHGEWDARAKWNMHARFIFRGGENWKDYFSQTIAWSHPDYPLLLPLLVVRGWSFWGREVIWSSIFIAFVYTFAVIGLLMFSLSVFRNKNVGLLAGILLLGTTFFVSHGASQYADIPISFYFLATMIFFCLRDHWSENKTCLYFAGMMATLAAWTNNEGLLFLIVVFFFHGAITFKIQEWKHYLKELLIMLFGSLPVLVIIFYFKVNLSPPNDLMAAQGFSHVLASIADLNRYYLICRSFVGQTVIFNNSILIVLFVFLLFVGVRLEKKNTGLVISLVVFLLMIMGHFCVYLITPRYLLFHLGNSLDRLFLQLWPCLIFLIFMLVAPYWPSDFSRKADTFFWFSGFRTTK